MGFASKLRRRRFPGALRAGPFNRKVAVTHLVAFMRQSRFLGVVWIQHRPQESVTRFPLLRLYPRSVTESWVEWKRLCLDGRTSICNLGAGQGTTSRLEVRIPRLAGWMVMHTGKGMPDTARIRCCPH